jgi:hypothetical protein
MVTYRDRAATPLIAYKISVFVPGLGTDVPLTLKHDRKLTFRNVELGRWILRQIQVAEKRYASMVLRCRSPYLKWANVSRVPSLLILSDLNDALAIIRERILTTLACGWF